MFIDRGCEAVPDAAVRALSARRVDTLNPGAGLEHGGVLLLGSGTADGASSLTALRDLRRRNPILIVYLCARAGGSVLGQITDYARAGADKLFTIGSVSDVAGLVAEVLERTAAPPPEIELRAVGAMKLPTRLLEWLQHVFRNANRPMPIDEVARALGQAARTIDEQLQDHDVPCLRDLWRCGQYSHLLELERRGVADVNDRARRTQLGDATDVAKFRYRLRVTMRRSARLAAFVAHIPSLAPLR